MDRHYLIHGVLPALGSALFFAIMAACLKIASVELPTPQLVFLRSIIGLIIILPIVLPRGLPYLKTGKLKLHLFRALISLCAMNCYFYAISSIALAEVTLLNASSPLFIGIMAILILEETVTLFTLSVLVIGFLGIGLILKPGTDFFTIGAVVALASGFFIACAKILIRYMADTEPVLRTVFYFSLFTTLYSAVTLIWFWETPTTRLLIITLIAGICATCGQTLLTYSFTHNPAVKVAPFTYATVLFASIFGWVGWQEIPDAGSAFGAVLVIGACLAMIFKHKIPNPWNKKTATD